jgi:hypothetical protein
MKAERWMARREQCRASNARTADIESFLVVAACGAGAD